MNDIVVQLQHIDGALMLIAFALLGIMVVLMIGGKE